MYVIVGASSGVGRSLAKEFASKGHDLTLISREERDTSALKSDLTLRFGVSVISVQLDLAVSQPDFTKIFDVVDSAGENFRGILLPAGMLIDNDTLEIATSEIERVFRVNCASMCKLISEVLRRAHKDSAFSIIGFGSIASIRGRGSNIVYSAAKAALRFYFESLRHACVGRGTVVQFYVLGYMDTNLAFGYNVPLPKGDPNKLARQVYLDVNKDIGERFFPYPWMIFSILIKMIPWRIYKYLKF